MTHDAGTVGRRRSGGRIAAVVSGVTLALLGAALLVGGGALLWGDAQKDDDGYLSTGSHRFGTSTYAVATDDLDVDLDTPNSIVDDELFGTVRVQATSRTAEPVF